MLQGEHSAILSTFIKLPFVLSVVVLSILSGSFTVLTTYLVNRKISRGCEHPFTSPEPVPHDCHPGKRDQRNVSSLQHGRAKIGQLNRAQ